MNLNCRKLFKIICGKLFNSTWRLQLFRNDNLTRLFKHISLLNFIKCHNPYYNKRIDTFLFYKISYCVLQWKSIQLCNCKCIVLQLDMEPLRAWFLAKGASHNYIWTLQGKVAYHARHHVKRQICKNLCITLIAKHYKN